MAVLHHFSIRLAKAVILKDAFSGENVSGQVSLHTDSGGQIINSHNGTYLIINAEKKEFCLEIESPVYQRKEIALTADEGIEAEEIYLYPSEAYPGKKNATVIKGRATPFEKIYFCIEDQEQVCKLLQDYENGDNEIFVFMKANRVNFSGLWYICEKEDCGEYFRAANASEEMERILPACPLNSSYKKKDARIYPAYECEADENGGIYLMISGLKPQKYVMRYKGDCEERSLQVEGNCRNVFPELSDCLNHE